MNDSKAWTAETLRTSMCKPSFERKIFVTRALHLLSVSFESGFRACGIEGIQEAMTRYGFYENRAMPHTADDKQTT